MHDAQWKKKITRHQHLWQLRLTELYIRWPLINAIPSRWQPFLGCAHPFLHWRRIHEHEERRVTFAPQHYTRKKRQSMQATSNPAARNSIFKGVWFNCCCIWYSDCPLSALLWLLLLNIQRDRVTHAREMLDRMTSLRLCSRSPERARPQSIRSLAGSKISFLNLLTWRTTTLFWLPLFMREWLFVQPRSPKNCFDMCGDQMRRYNLIFTQETCFW